MKTGKKKEKNKKKLRDDDDNDWRQALIAATAKYSIMCCQRIVPY